MNHEQSTINMMTRWGLLLLMIACGSVSCAKHADPDADRVQVFLSSNPRSLDPAFATDFASGLVVSKIYNGLVTFEGAGVGPDLADRWSISPDGRRYEFHLRAGVRFHDGRPLTAFDVARCFNRIMDTATASPRRWVFEAVERVTAADSSLLVIRLKTPSAPFLKLLAMPAALINALPEGAAPADLSRHPIGTGPYRLERWEDDAEILLQRNDDYFAGAPAVPGIVFNVIPESLTALALLRQGHLDLCEVPDAQLDVFRLDANWRGRIQTSEELAVSYVAINNERLADSRVRLALNLAVDREKIVDRVLADLGASAGGPVPPALSGETRPILPFDPARARTLLEQAGFDFSRPLVFLRAAKRGSLEQAEAVAGYLRDIGVRVEVVPMEYSSMQARTNRGDFDLALYNWYADYADAENFLKPLFHSSNVGGAGNRARFRDTAVDEAIERAVALPEGKARAAALSRAEKMVIERVPWILLWYPHTAVAVSPRFQGYVKPVIMSADKGTTYRILDF